MHLGKYQTAIILSEREKQDFSFDALKSFWQKELPQNFLYNIEYKTNFEVIDYQNNSQETKNIFVFESFPQDWNSHLSYLDFVKSLPEQSSHWLVDYLPFFYKTSALFAKLPIQPFYSELAQKDQTNLQKIFSFEGNKVFFAGGSQLPDLLRLGELFANVFDVFLFAGKNSHTLLHSRLISVGDSDIEKNLLSKCFQLIDKLLFNKKEFFLPIDHISKNNSNGKIKNQKNKIEKGFSGIDIGSKTISLYKNHIKKASLILYYGSASCLPLDKNNISKSDLAIVHAIANSSAEKIIVGSEAIAIAQALDVIDKFSWIIENENLLLDVSAKQIKI